MNKKLCLSKRLVILLFLFFVNGCSTEILHNPNQLNTEKDKEEEIIFDHHNEDKDPSVFFENDDEDFSNINSNIDFQHSDSTPSSQENSPITFPNGDKIRNDFNSRHPLPNNNPNNFEGTEFGNPNIDFDGVEFGNPSSVIKGPFQMDSSVNIQIINEHLSPLGNNFLVFVEDNLGSFSIPENLDSDFIEVISQGFYFNEVSGDISDVPLTLGAYVHFNENNTPKVNILTTLAQKRIKKLVQINGLNFEEAQNQAQIEVLNTFHIHENNIENFDELTISRNTKGDAILLAISVILQGNLSTNHLSNFIADIKEDLKDNGRIDDQDLNSQICEQTKILEVLSIRNHLQEYYDENDANDRRIPLFEDYLDSDCDGIINKDDQESLVFFKEKMNHKYFSGRMNFNIFKHDNKIYYSGNQNNFLVASENFGNLFSWRSFPDCYDPTREYREQISLLEYPIMINLNDNLFIMGGRKSLRDHRNSILKIDNMGIFKINNNENCTRKIRSYGYGDLNFRDNNHEFVRAYLNESLEDNIYPNFSTPNHYSFVYENKIYIGKRNRVYIQGNDDLIGFYGTMYTRNGLQWNEDDLSDYLDEIENGINDILVYNGEIYLSIKTDPLHIHQIPERENIRIVEDLNYLFEYQNQIYGFYVRNLYENSNLLFKRLTINDNLISSERINTPFENFKLYHKPIVFNNLIHLFTEDYLLLIGTYRSYKEYLDIDPEPIFNPVEIQIREDQNDLRDRILPIIN